MKHSLVELRDEHRREVIGPALADLLESVVKSVAAIYPPSVYSRTGTWQDGTLEELLQGWVIDRLLTRNDLSAILGSVNGVSHLRAKLSTSFRQYLLNQALRSSARNLYQRTQDFLRADQRFAKVSSGGRSNADLWTLASSKNGDPSPLDLRELTLRAWEMSDDELEVIRYKPGSRKSSPILRDPKLAQFIVHLFGRAEGSLTMGQVIEVMRRRFSLIDPKNVELTDKVVSTDERETAVVDRQDVVRSVVSQLGLVGVRAIRAIEESNGQVDSAAQRLGWEPARLVLELQSISAVVRQFAENRDEEFAIYSDVLRIVVLKGLNDGN
jgi:hypothetical protein